MEHICTRCLRQAARRSLGRHRPPIRPFSYTSRQNQATPVTAQTTTATNPRPNNVPAATSTSAAQPFSTPLSPSPDGQDLPVRPRGQTVEVSPKRVKSSVRAGTLLRGLNFIKGRLDPVALEDHEYPAWLWGLLDKSGDAADGMDGQGEGDLFSKSKKQRRLAAKIQRKQQLLNPGLLAPKVPLHEQSIDLPSGDGTLRGALDAAGARGDLTQAMRDVRRKNIKEKNFLKSVG